MINDIKECWICKKPIGKSGSEHHLFNFYDFKEKLLETFGEINKKTIRAKWNKIKDKIPSYKVHYDCHKELEKRLRNNYNLRTGWK